MRRLLKNVKDSSNTLVHSDIPIVSENHSVHLELQFQFQLQKKTIVPKIHEKISQEARGQERLAPPAP